MRFIITALTCAVVGVYAFAQDQAEQPTQEQIEMMYKISCDPDTLKGADEKEAKELAEFRDQVQVVLKEGQAGFDKLVKEGDEQDIGPLGAIMACSIVDTIKGEIAAKGCKDNAGKAIDTKAGVELCATIVSELKKISDQ